MPIFKALVNERTSGQFTAILTDPTGASVAGSALTTLELWLYDVDTNQTLNGRGTVGGPGQDVLNKNNVTVDVNGLLTWEVRPEDNVIVDPSKPTEKHRAELKATWGASPVKGLTHVIEIDVRNLTQVA